MSAQSKVFYSPAYVVDASLETVSKAAHVAELVRQIAGVELVAPAPATRAELLRVHDAAYVDAILNGTQSHTAAGDWSPALRDSVLASTGGMRSAVGEALHTGRSGSLSSGLHHASASHGQGFCVFNGLALAARIALDSVGVVGVLDLDAHCGGGTASILGDDPRVRIADVSVSSFDSWSSKQARHHTAMIHKAENYLPAVDVALEHLRGVKFVLYNAGMDPHEGSGGLRGVGTEMLTERERRVAAWCQAEKVPVVFALAGGYLWGGLTMAELAGLHAVTVAAFSQ